jgi:hypothetical protein
MWDELSTETGKKQFGSIKSILRGMKNSPDAGMADENELKALLSRLADHCISKADAIICTISNALKLSFVQMVSHQINFAIIDEAGKVGHVAFLGLVGSYQPVTWVHHTCFAESHSSGYIWVFLQVCRTSETHGQIQMPSCGLCT